MDVGDVNSEDVESLLFLATRVYALYAAVISIQRLLSTQLSTDST
ncbi:unnamed protein product [Arabidopsis halleri]